jgi:hypothetical protein
MKNYSFFFTSQTFQGLSGRKSARLRVHYHQISIECTEMELQKLKNTNVLVRVIFDQKSKNTRLTIDLKEIGKGSDGENKWASSSARIEHQP